MSGVLPLEFFSGVAFDQDRDEVADGSAVEAVMYLRHGADDRVAGVAVGEGMAESFVHCLDGLRLTDFRLYFHVWAYAQIRWPDDTGPDEQSHGIGAGCGRAVRFVRGLSAGLDRNAHE